MWLMSLLDALEQVSKPKLAGQKPHRIRESV